MSSSAIQRWGERPHCKATKDSCFPLKPGSPTHRRLYNTDTVTHSTVTHSNHNSESAASQTYRQTPLSANVHAHTKLVAEDPWISFRPLGDFLVVLLSFACFSRVSLLSGSADSEVRILMRTGERLRDSSAICNCRVFADFHVMFFFPSHLPLFIHTHPMTGCHLNL